MLIFDKIKQLCKAVFVGFLVSFLWLQAPTAAVAENANPTAYTKSESLQAVVDCIPEEVTPKNEDIQQRIAQAFGEMGNDYLERTFKLTDDPDLSEVEAEFESCMKSKGLIPKREANF